MLSEPLASRRTTAIQILGAMGAAEDAGRSRPGVRKAAQDALGLTNDCLENGQTRCSSSVS